MKKKSFCIALFAMILLFSCTKKSSFVLDIPDFYQTELLESSSQNIHFYSFTAEQKEKIRIFDIGPTIGSHTGPGTVAIGFWGLKKER